jgi:hypothetical protein
MRQNWPYCCLICLHFDQLLGEFSSPARKSIDETDLANFKKGWLPRALLGAIDPSVQTPLGDSEWEVSNE